MSEPQQTEMSILEAARRMEAEERTVFLDETCGADSHMRQRVESLLAQQTPSTSSDPATPSSDLGPSGTIVSDRDATIDQTTTVGLAAEEAPGDTIGRYKLLEKIGEGGFGMVYVAEQTEPVKRRVALKIIKLGMDTRQVVGRFEAERQALALMDHPNIARVFDAGATDTGRPYFVMELVRGTKITEHCDKYKLSTRKRMDLFMTVCRAIEHAHQKGIIHRDIKPSNILVTMHDGVPAPKVIDFGIAKATQGSLTGKTVYTQFDQFVGTPAYMSPEQAEAGGLDIDTRSDIYSLGVLLYELLTGETPLESKNLLARGFDEMRKLIREWEPQLPSILLHKRDAEDQTTVATKHGTDAPKLIKMVRGDLDWVVMKCLEKDRARRYDSAAELTAEIERFLADEPVAARPPSKVYRFKKLVRRNQLAFAAGSIVLAALVIGLAVTLWFVVKEKDARDTAERANDIAERNLKIAVDARAQAEQALADAEKAHQQSSVDQQLSLAAEKRAETARRDAEDSQQKAAKARQEADAALAQSKQDRAKAALAEKQSAEAQAEAKTARQLAEAAQNRAISEAAKREEATKFAVTETDLRKKAEALFREATNTAHLAQEEAGKARQEADQSQKTVSNLLANSLAPWSGGDLALIGALTQPAIAGTNDPRHYDSELALGLVRYRQGKYADATNWLSQALAGAGQNAARDAQACAALALAQFQLKQTNEARTNLDRGGQIMAAQAPKLDNADLGPAWSQWVMARALLREAGNLISATNSTNAPAPLK